MNILLKVFIHLYSVLGAEVDQWRVVVVVYSTLGVRKEMEQRKYMERILVDTPLVPRHFVSKQIHLSVISTYSAHSCHKIKIVPFSTAIVVLFSKRLNSSHS